MRDVSMDDLESGLKSPPKDRHGVFDALLRLGSGTRVLSAPRGRQYRTVLVAVVLICFGLLLGFGFFGVRDRELVLSNVLELHDGRPAPFAEFSNLVMVAGHAVFTSPNYANADEEVSFGLLCSWTCRICIWNLYPHLQLKLHKDSKSQ